MSDDRQERDYTKTRQYAVIDLGAKIISALALVILGAAGASLQWHSEITRENTEAREHNERKFVPMLRGLSMLELTLESINTERHDDQNSDDLQQAQYDLGTKLRFTAESVFVPDGDPNVSLRPPDRRPGEDRRIDLPLRATAIMCAELMRMKSFMKSDDTFRLEPNGKFLLTQRSLRLSNGTSSESVMSSSILNVAPESLPAWKLWLGERTFRMSDIRGLMFSLIDLRYACSSEIQVVLNLHGDVADRYVEIREEVERNRNLTSKPDLSVHSSGK